MSDNDQTLAAKCLTQLEEIDIRPGKIFRNLTVPELLEVAIHRMEGEFSDTGSACALMSPQGTCLNGAGLQGDEPELRKPNWTSK